MKKAGVLSILFLVVLLAVAVIAQAQQPKKVPRIGFLSGTSSNPRREAFSQGLRELGYVEGKNVVIEWGFAPKDLRGAAYVFAYMADSLWHVNGTVRHRQTVN